MKQNVLYLQGKGYARAVNRISSLDYSKSKNVLNFAFFYNEIINSLVKMER